MSLARKLLGVPSGSDTLESVTSGNSDGIDHLVLRENGINGNLLLEMLLSPVDFFRDSSTIDLDLHDVSLLLLALKDGHLNKHVRFIKRRARPGCGR